MERGLSDRILTAVQQLEGGTATSLPYSTNIGRGSYSPAVSAGQGSVVREVVAPTYEFTGDVANALMRLANAPGAAFRTATNLAREQENPFAPFRELMPEGFSGRPAENQYAAIAREEANLPGSVSEIVGLIVEAGLDPSIAGEVALAKSVPSALASLSFLVPSGLSRIINNGSKVEFVPTEFLASIPGNPLRRSYGEQKDFVQELMNNPEGLTEAPYIVYFADTGRYMVGEGNHRVAAARAAGVPFLPVTVIRMQGEGPRGYPMPESVVQRINEFKKRNYGYAPGSPYPSELDIPTVSNEEVISWLRSRNTSESELNDLSDLLMRMEENKRFELR